MNKNSMVATVAGTFLLLILGYLFYGIALADFFASNSGSVTNLMKDPPDWPILILGQLATALLLVTVLGWKGDADLASGAKTGACVGLLWGLGYGLTMHATTNISNLTAALVDPLVATVMFGITGAVMGMLLGKGE